MPRKDGGKTFTPFNKGEKVLFRGPFSLRTASRWVMYVFGGQRMGCFSRADSQTWNFEDIVSHLLAMRYLPEECPFSSAKSAQRNVSPMAEIMKRATLDYLLIQSFFLSPRRGLPLSFVREEKVAARNSPRESQKCWGGGGDPGRRWKSPSFLLLLFPVLSLSNVVETTRWHKRGAGGRRRRGRRIVVTAPLAVLARGGRGMGGRPRSHLYISERELGRGGDGKTM